MEREAVSAVQALERRLAAANRMHTAGAWLTETAAGAQGLELRDDMIAATISADHYQARIVCPRRLWRRLRGQEWQQYARRRAGQALGRFADLMLRWTVLERIPVNWISQEVVFAQIRAGLAGEGYAGVGIEGNLQPPFPGGADWVRAECQPEIEALSGGNADSLRAAVVYWPDRVTAVVLAKGFEDFMAYSPRLQRGGVALRWEGPNAVVGLLLLPPPETPPSGRFMAMCRTLGFGDWVWEVSRGWRIWRHDR